MFFIFVIHAAKEIELPGFYMLTAPPLYMMKRYEVNNNKYLDISNWEDLQLKFPKLNNMLLFELNMNQSGYRHCLMKD